MSLLGLESEYVRHHVPRPGNFMTSPARPDNKHRSTATGGSLSGQKCYGDMRPCEAMSKSCVSGFLPCGFWG